MNRVVKVFWAVALTLSVAGCATEENVSKPKPKPKPSAKKAPVAVVSSINESIDFKLPDSYKKLSSEERRRKAQVFLELAKDYKDKHDQEKQVESATLAIKLNPMLAEAYLLRGKALYQSAYGDDRAALEDLKKATELDPNLPDAYQYLGRLYDSQKEYELAVAAYDKAIIANRHDRDSRTMKASDLRTLGRVGEAIDVYTGIMQEFPRKSQPYLQRGELYEYLQQYDKALADYSIAADMKESEKDLGSTQPFRARAKLYSKLNRSRDAIGDFDQILKRDPYDEESLRLRALEYLKLGDEPKALADLNRSIELAPDYGRASYEARAKIFKRQGKQALADADLKKASSIKAKPAEVPIYSIKREK